MAVFEDLSPYRYGLGAVPWGAEGPEVGAPPFQWVWDIVAPEPIFADEEVNIGWIEPGDVTSGCVSRDALSTIEHICLSSTYHATRGRHPCSMCDYEGPLGSAEVRVQGAGVVYAAPNLVAHYMCSHGYVPPREFVRALERGGPAPVPSAPGPREIPAELLYRHAVPEGALRSSLEAALARKTDSKEIELLAVKWEGDLLIRVRLRPSLRGSGVVLERTVPKSCVYNLDQATTSIAYMVLANLFELKEATIGAEFRRRVTGASTRKR